MIKKTPACTRLNYSCSLTYFTGYRWPIATFAAHTKFNSKPENGTQQNDAILPVSFVRAEQYAQQ